MNTEARCCSIRGLNFCELMLIYYSHCYGDENEEVKSLTLMRFIQPCILLYKFCFLLSHVDYVVKRRIRDRKKFAVECSVEISKCSILEPKIVVLKCLSACLLLFLLLSLCRLKASVKCTGPILFKTTKTSCTKPLF